MMNAITLVVRGDGLGLCHAANQAIWEAFETGVLTGASLVVAGPWVAEAAALAREYPEWEIGLQLVLTCPGVGCRWGPVLGPTAVPSLVEPAGVFPPVLSSSADPGEIAREFAAQLERARAWGCSPAYLEHDGEKRPAVEAALKELSEQTGIPAGMAGWGLQPLVLAAGEPAARTATLRQALEALTPGAYLWVARPAQDSPEAEALWGAEEAALRAADLAALCSTEVIDCIRRRGIDPVSFRQHLEARIGTDAEE